MQKITIPQLKKLHVLMNVLKIDEEMKVEIIRQTSSNRTISSKELYMNEARNLINQLSKHDPADKMIKKVFALAYVAGIIYGDTPEDKKMNAAKLNKFLLEKGTVRKELSKMNSAELIKTVNQFEQINKHKDYSIAKKSTDSLLSELNVQSQFKSRSKAI